MSRLFENHNQDPRCLKPALGHCGFLGRLLSCLFVLVRALRCCPLQELRDEAHQRWLRVHAFAEKHGPAVLEAVLSCEVPEGGKRGWADAHLEGPMEYIALLQRGESGRCL
eukprot:7811214-Alexandrium_andersonii.AAC.1